MVGGGKESLLKRRSTYIRYEEWKGNNNFFFDGALMFGADGKFFITTQFIILVPSTLFMVFVVPDLPHAHSILGGLITCGLFMMFFLWMAALTEPGIIPRCPKHEVPDLPPPGSNMGPNGWKLCVTCNVYRPPRAKHCSYCDNCVEELDHHCPWTGNCIGKRNYVYFFRFIILVTCKILFLDAFTHIFLSYSYI